MAGAPARHRLLSYTRHSLQTKHMMHLCTLHRRSATFPRRPKADSHELSLLEQRTFDAVTPRAACHSKHGVCRQLPGCPMSTINQKCLSNPKHLARHISSHQQTLELTALRVGPKTAGTLTFSHEVRDSTDCRHSPWIKGPIETVRSTMKTIKEKSHRIVCVQCRRYAQARKHHSIWSGQKMNGAGLH